VTAAYVDWATGAWSSGLWYDSADISSVVQEFIDRPGYMSGNYLGIRVHQESGADYKRACSYDYTGNVSGPKLVVTYTTGN